MTISGSDWLPGLPKRWEVVPAKSLFALRSEPNAADDQHLTPSQKYGVVPQADYMEMTGSRVVLALTGADSMQHVDQGDFVIHLRSFQGGIEYSQYRGKVSPAYTVLRPRAHVHAPFYRHMLKAERYIQALRVTVNQLRDGQSIRYQDFGKVALPLPPISEQVTIANFLVRETAKIDAFIDVQQRMLEALQERSSRARDAALGSLVGKGARSRWLFHELDFRAGEQLAGLPLMSVSIDWGVRRRDEVTEDLSRADDLRNYKVARAGDIVINRMRAFQGALGVAPEDGLVSPDYAVLRAARTVDAVWLTELMKTARFVSEMTSRLRGIGTIEVGSVRTPRVSVDDIGQILVQAPSIECQRDQLRSLLGDREGNMQLIAKVRRHVDLAQERRSALITAAVTGQLDIGGAA